MKKSDQETRDHTGPQFSLTDSSRPGILAFQQMVLSHYEQYGRDMAWRNTTDPYPILVSEIMLQQTQVERVTTKFPEFIHAFPDFAALAAAPLGNVLTVWQGMGYNRRAIALQKCAIRVMNEYEGILPPDVAILTTFPGIGRATLVKAVASCNNELAGVEDIIREQLKGGPVLHVDETGFRVNGIRHWLHVASTGLLTWYGYHKKRGSTATDDMQILPAFKGTMVHDFWKSYFRYGCRHALCNAHLIRELTGISETYGHEWSSQMNELLHDIKKAVDSARVSSSGLTHQQITEFELRYSRIISIGIRENPVPVCSGIPVKRGRKKQSKAKNLLDRCQLHQREILAFMYDFMIPFENNQAERDIRMVKLQQKISGTFRSDEGAAWFCRIRGYISTVKKNGEPVLASLVGAFEKKPFVPQASYSC